MLRVVAQALLFLYQCVCRSLSLSFSDTVGGHQWEVWALSVVIHAGAHHRWSAEEGFHL
jgi:hypothetical protein